VITRLLTQIGGYLLMWPYALWSYWRDPPGLVFHLPLPTAEDLEEMRGEKP
jgi:hypothetical protein